MPFDGRNLEEWQTTLLKAAEIVRERWNSSGYGLPGGPRCALGAIDEAAGGHLFSDSPAIYRLQNHIDTSIAVWNDTPGRTAEEVASVMESVALQQGRA